MLLQVRAIRFGEPDVLLMSEAPGPTAGPGQVVIDVFAADTLHVDTVIRRGAFPFPVVEPPYVPGGGVAGTVASVGPGVDRGLLGRPVVARTGVSEPRAEVETVAQLAQRDSHAGGYAQRAVVPAGAVIPVPAAVGLAEAVALVNDGMTAVLLAETARIRSAEWVLVTPAGGGVGNLLVQLAHNAGARVVGAARGERKLEHALASGADAAVDYEDEGWVERIRSLTGGRGPDVVLDGVGGRIGRASLNETARGGRFLGYGGPSGEFTRVSPEDADRCGITAVSLFDVRMRAGNDRRCTEVALAEAAAGRIRPLVGQTFPLERAAEAHAAIESRAVVGKTLLMT